MNQLIDCLIKSPATSEQIDIIGGWFKRIDRARKYRDLAELRRVAGKMSGWECPAVADSDYPSFLARYHNWQVITQSMARELYAVAGRIESIRRHNALCLTNFR